MWVYEERDSLWQVVRWAVQDKAYWSKCDATVLYGVTVKCAEGHAALGYRLTEVLPNHDKDFYRDLMTRITSSTLDALYQWHFVDGTLAKSNRFFQDAAERISNCATAVGDASPGALTITPAAG